MQVGDVALTYLDWGGGGSPLVLLPGLGDTPHIFSAIAPRLTVQHRVLGLCRRGHGGSDTPPGGYDPQTLARDISAFLQALDLEGVTLVGHSIAGNEMTALAAAGEARLAGLVYLDAAYDRRGTRERMRRDPLLARPVPSRVHSQARDFDGYRERAREFFGFWNAALEANLRARLHPDGEGGLRGAPPFVAQGILEASERFAPPYDQVSVPRLAFYAPFGDDHWAPYDRSDAELRQAVGRFMREVMHPWQRCCIEAFTAGPGAARAVEVAGAHHYLFLSHEDRVVEEVLSFTEGSGQEGELADD